MNLLEERDIVELIILYQNETEFEKKIKKCIFIIISIIFPLFEIIILIFQFIDINEKLKLNINGKLILREIIIFFILSSLFCTWSMMSICYYDSKCLTIILILKTVFIFIIFLLSCESENYYYYIVFNVLGYGVFYTLILIYKSFKKGVI